MSGSDVRQAFEQTGIAVIRGAFEASFAGALAHEVDALVAARDVSGGPWKYLDDEAHARGENILSRVERFVPHSERWRAVLCGALARHVADACGEPVVLFKDKINLKLPGSGGFAAHQDVQAGWDAFAPVHVTAMLSLDATTRENGCLEVVHGPRIRALVGDRWRPLDDAQLAGLSFSLIETQPGDVVIFDSYVVHRSAPNRTRSPRRVLYATYNVASFGDHYDAYFAKKHASYPPNIDRDPSRVYRYKV